MRGQFVERHAVEPQLGAAALQERCSGQVRHFVGPEAGAAALGRVSGPFWPQADSATAHASNNARVDARRAARVDTLGLGFIDQILSTVPNEPAVTDAEYRQRANAVLAAIEATLDSWLQRDLIDIDSHRSGGMLEMTLPDGSKVIVNLQPPLQELWLAARAGGHHYRWSGGRWVDTRDGSEFFTSLSAHVSQQAGRELTFTAPAG